MDDNMQAPINRNYSCDCEWQHPVLHKTSAIQGKTGRPKQAQLLLLRQNLDQITKDYILLKSFQSPKGMQNLAFYQCWQFVLTHRILWHCGWSNLPYTASYFHEWRRFRAIEAHTKELADRANFIHNLPEQLSNALLWNKMKAKPQKSTYMH